jgi:hypothetical protein
MQSVSVSSVIEMLSEKGKVLLIVDGFKFRFHKMLCDDVKRWLCTRKTCKAYIKRKHDVIVEAFLEHNHESDSDQTLNRQKLSNSLKRKATEDICEKPSKLLHRELHSKHVDTLTVTNVNLIRKNIHNARKHILPQIPTSISDVHDALDAIEITTNNNEQFLLFNDRNSNIVMFSCRTNLTFLSKLDTIYVDRTFRCCPKFFTQLFTIHGLQNDHYIPLVFFLLPNKSVSSYSDAFRRIVEECAKLNLKFSPETIYADFEKAIHSAASFIWPESDIKGCRFHLGQSW